jgi:hypothetical protein
MFGFFFTHVGVLHSHQPTTQLTVVPFLANSQLLCDVKSFPPLLGVSRMKGIDDFFNVV